MELEAALTAQVGSKPPEQVTELVLDTCKLASTALAGLEKFSNLTRLTLNGCSLTSLEGFPQLDNLKSLELTDNQLSEGLEALQDAGLLALTRLSLAGNRFASLDSLEPLVRAACHTAAQPAVCRRQPAVRQTARHAGQTAASHRAHTRVCCSLAQCRRRAWSCSTTSTSTTAP